MTGVVLHSSASGFLSNLALFWLMATVVPIGLLLAPQAVRRDRRTILAVLLILLVLGATASAEAAATQICKYAWWAFECWFL